MSLDTSCSKADLPRPLLFVRPFDCVSIARRDTAILEIEQRWLYPKPRKLWAGTRLTLASRSNRRRWLTTGAAKKNPAW